MPAALLMALLQGSLRTLLTAGHRGAELVARLNEYLSSSIPKNTFVTLFYAELDTLTGQFRYVNAGHNPPFHLTSAGGIERLTPTSDSGVIRTPFRRTLCVAPASRSAG
jgi:sigma-B regulation protein RsbU (phosphoserine phosphatase)